MTGLWRVGFTVGMGIAACACGGNGSGAGPAQGAERQACYPNHTCNAGLTCLSDVCVKLEGPDSGTVVPSVDAGTANGLVDATAPDAVAMVIGPGRVCVPGFPRACTCGGGGPGTQVCNAGGTGYLGCGGCPPSGSNDLCTVPDVATRAHVTNDVLADFEGATPRVIKSVTPGGIWYSYQDNETGTVFKPDPDAWSVESPGHGGTASALHVAGSGFMGPVSGTNWGAGTGFALGGLTPGGLTTETGVTPMAADVSAYKGISFYAKSSMASDIFVGFPTAETSPDYCTCNEALICYAVHGVLVPAIAADWTKYTIEFSVLQQPSYVFSSIPFDRTSLLEIDFQSNGPIPAFDFWIDDITLIH